MCVFFKCTWKAQALNISTAHFFYFSVIIDRRDSGNTIKKNKINRYLTAAKSYAREQKNPKKLDDSKVIK